MHNSPLNTLNLSFLLHLFLTAEEYREIDFFVTVKSYAKTFAQKLLIFFSLLTHPYNVSDTTLVL